MRKLFRRYLPQHETVKNQRWLKPFGSLLHHPNLWHLHRRSVAGGVAVGLFFGLVPGPFQMIGAALCAAALRVNLSVAVFTTLYSNPFTILPLYVLAYELGAWVSGVRNGVQVAQLSFLDLHWDSWVNELWSWLMMLGKPILIGMPLLAVCLAVAGYFAVRLMWRVAVLLEWRARKRRRIV